MLIYKKATKEELEKYRQTQLASSQKDKVLKTVPQADLNVLLELFLTFANQRTFTVNVADIEFQNTLLGLNQDSTLFANVLAKMSNSGALNFIDFAKLYYQSVGSRNSDDEIAELFSTISKDGTIDRDHLNKIANELGYTLKQADLDQIMILMNKGEPFTLDHLNTYLTETMSSRAIIK